tara:strand:+ start:6107 stop:6784 length:678 start_codon:yes stop_codon:yes gene_type:complete
MKNCIITGASRGVGMALAQQLYTKRYGLGLVARTFDNDSLPENNSTVYKYRYDISKVDQTLKFCERVKQDFETVDILINNVGFNTHKTRIEDFGLQEYSDIIDLNLKSHFYITNQLLPIMQQQQSGHIINICGGIAYQLKEDWAPYASAKSGMIAFSRILSKECIPHKIKVTTIIPCGIETTFHDGPRPNYMSAESVASMIVMAVEAPDDLVVHELILKPLEEIC